MFDSSRLILMPQRSSHILTRISLNTRDPHIAATTPYPWEEEEKEDFFVAFKELNNRGWNSI